MDRYEALKHAVKAHAGQVDKCGQPYILHPIAVAEAIERTPFSAPPFEEGVDLGIVALLHDVREDTDYPLHAPLFSNAQATEFSALLAITKDDDETYGAYIARVCSCWPAAVVKLADLWHNLSLERQDCLPEKERRGLEKRYLKARDRIWEALGYEWWPEGGG